MLAHTVHPSFRESSRTDGPATTLFLYRVRLSHVDAQAPGRLPDPFQRRTTHFHDAIAVDVSMRVECPSSQRGSTEPKPPMVFAAMEGRSTLIAWWKVLASMSFLAVFSSLHAHIDAEAATLSVQVESREGQGSRRQCVRGHGA